VRAAAAHRHTLDSYILSYAEHFLIIITKIIKTEAKRRSSRRKGLESTKEDQNNEQRTKDEERTRMILNCARGLTTLTKLKERMGYVHPDRTAYATTILQLFSSPVTH